MAAAGHTCIVQKEDERNQRDPDEPIYTMAALDGTMTILHFRQVISDPQNNTSSNLPLWKSK